MLKGEPIRAMGSLTSGVETIVDVTMLEVSVYVIPAEGRGCYTQKENWFVRVDPADNCTLRAHV